jgi:hypothetical protein
MRLASVEVSNTVLVNTPLYRLLDIDIARHRLEGVVNLADFASYALTMDLLETELTGALAAAIPQRAGDGVVSAEVAAQLPLRDRYSPVWPQPGPSISGFAWEDQLRCSPPRGGAPEAVTTSGTTCC